MAMGFTTILSLIAVLCLSYIFCAKYITLVSTCLSRFSSVKSFTIHNVVLSWCQIWNQTSKPVLDSLKSLETIKISSMHILFDKCMNEYGSVIKLKVSLFGRCAFVLSSGDALRKAFSSREFSQVLNDRPDSFLGKYLGFNSSGIFFSKYDHHLFKMRRAMHAGIRLYGDGLSKFEDMADKELCQLVQNIPQDVDVNPTQLIRASMGNIILNMLLGCSAGAEDVELLWDMALSANEMLHPVLETVLVSLPVLRHLPGKPGRLYRKAVQSRDEFLDKHISDSQIPDTAEAGGFLSTLRSLQKKSDYSWLTDTHLKALVSDFVAGGLLTTTSAVLCAILILVHHDTCRSRLQAEIDNITRAGRAPTLQDRRSMPYTEAFIMEVFRYISHVPLVLHSSTIDVTFEGYSIPKNSLFIGNLWSIHHDAAVWGDPWTFRPERFLDIHGQLLPADHKLRQSFLAFGTGRRACVGETLGRSRLFLCIAKLLHHFHITPPKSSPLADADPRCYKGGAVLQPPEFTCRFTRRR